MFIASFGAWFSYVIASCVRSCIQAALYEDRDNRGYHGNKAPDSAHYLETVSRAVYASSFNKSGFARPTLARLPTVLPPTV